MLSAETLATIRSTAPLVAEQALADLAIRERRVVVRDLADAGGALQRFACGRTDVGRAGGRLETGDGGRFEHGGPGRDGIRR